MMKQFLNTLLRFSILPMLVLLLLEGSIAWQKKNLFSEKRLDKVYAGSGAPYNWIKKVKHDNKVVLIGSSTVKYGLSCTRLNELYNDSLAFLNLAADARDPIESYFILKQIDLSNVKAVYFGIDPWIYSRRYYRSRKSYIYLDLDLLTAFRYSSEFDSRLFPRRYKALFTSFFPISQKVETDNTIPPDFGSLSLNRRPTNFNNPINKRFQLNKYGWSDLEFVYLQKMALFCEGRNILFTAFYPPKRSDFVADYKTKCTDIHASFLKKLKDAGFTSPIIGSFDQLQPYGDSLFADAYHLNGKGQEVYTEIFFRIINDLKYVQ